jgi:hypothetical protein
MLDRSVRCGQKPLSRTLRMPFEQRDTLLTNHLPPRKLSAMNTHTAFRLATQVVTMTMAMSMETLQRAWEAL